MSSGAVPSSRGGPSARPRLLLLAYACSPYHGSEPKIGWNRVVEAARYFDVWVVCEQREFEADIQDFENRYGRLAGVRWHFVPLTDREEALKTTPLLNVGAFRGWHRRAGRLAVRLHDEIQFDLVHQVNIIGFREPGYGWTLDAPFVWGPVGGTQNFPWRFLPTLRPRAATLEVARNVINRLQLWASPRVRRAARRAEVLVAANSTVQRDMAPLWGAPPPILCDLGIRHVGIPKRWRERTPGPVRVLWVGVCEPRKGVGLMARAFKHLPTDEFELIVLGDGPDADLFRALPGCHYRGRVSYDEALRTYAEADLFAFSSLRDTLGGVNLEALANGLPIVCLDHQGVGDVVTEACGVKVPVTTPRVAAADFAAAIRGVVADAARYDRMSEAAVDRARDYLWKRSGETMRGFYEQVLGQRGTERTVLPPALRSSVGR